MPGRTRVIIYDSQIRHLFDPGENAIEFIKDVNDSILARAQNIEAPRGNAQSGRIRQGHRPLRDYHKSRGVLRRGPYGADTAAINDAPHALFVHEGTRAVITPTGSRYLAVPVPAGTRVLRLEPTPRNRAVATGLRREGTSKGNPAQPSGGVILTPAVRGQASNPWLARAGNAVVAEYRAKAYYRNWSKGGTRLTGGLRA